MNANDNKKSALEQANDHFAALEAGTVAGGNDYLFSDCELMINMLRALRDSLKFKRLDMGERHELMCGIDVVLEEVTGDA